MSNTKPYDQAFKYLAEQDPESLLLLLGALRPGQKAKIELLPRELSVSVLLPDQPYQVVIGEEAEIVHVEAQTVFEYDLMELEPDYGARLWMKYRLPVRSYILLLTKRKLPGRLPRVWRLQAGDVQIAVRPRLVRLWEIPATQALAPGRENLLPFVPLMKGGGRYLEEGARRLKAVADVQRRRDLSLHFLMLGGLSYNREDLLDLIVRKGMIPWEQFKESSFYQLIMEEGRAEGREEGRAEGREEGRAEGRREGELKTAVEMLRLLAAKRFPGLQLGDELERIRDVAALQQLCVDLIDLPDEAALRQRIAALLAADKQ